MFKMFLPAIAAVCIGIGAAQSAEVVITVRPPRNVVEQRPVRPDQSHIWVGGYQKWDGHAYGWESGRWEKPPHAHAVWVAPKYSHHGNGYVYSEGHWR